MIRFSMTLYAILMLSCLFLLILAVCFMFLAILLWIYNHYRDKKIKALHAVWQNIVFEKILNPKAVPLAPVSVSKADEGVFLDYLMEAARRLQGEAFESLCALAAPYLPQVAKESTSRTIPKRAWAIRVLGTFGLPHYLKQITAALRDKSPLIRLIALRSLIINGQVKLLNQLIEGLTALPHWNSNFLASLLASLGPRVTEQLRHYFLADQTSDSVKVVLGIALRQLNDPNASPIAEKLLMSHPSRNLAVACLRLLYSVGLPEQANVVRTLCRSVDPVVRAQAVRTLGQLGGKSDHEIFEKALQDADPWVAIHAAESLKTIGFHDVLKSVSQKQGLQSLAAKEALQ